MQLTIFNGSPRGKGSNTKILLSHFLDGFMQREGNSYSAYYLVRIKDSLKLFMESEMVLLAFPLYHDSMPAIVKNFIESLEPLCGRTGNPAVGFLVQGGFPESAHSRAVEQYLKKLTARLGCKYMGTIIKGGVEGIQAKPPWMTRRLFKSFYNLGRVFGETGRFDERLILRLAKPERMTRFGLYMFKIFAKIGLANLYWDMQLKKNNAFERRFDRPYAIGGNKNKLTT